MNFTLDIYFTIGYFSCMLFVKICESPAVCNFDIVGFIIRAESNVSGIAFGRSWHGIANDSDIVTSLLVHSGQNL